MALIAYEDALKTSQVERLPGSSQPSQFAEPVIPSVGEVVAGTFRTENTTTSFFANDDSDLTYAKVAGGIDVVPLVPERYKSDLNDYLGAADEEDVKRITLQKDTFHQDRENMAKRPFVSFVAGMAAGLLDPTSLIPGGLAFKTIRTGVRAAKASMASAALVSGAVGIQEAELHSTQVDRTIDESAMNIAGAALLGGFLGGAVGGLSPAAKGVAEATLGDTLGKTHTGLFQLGSMKIKDGKIVSGFSAGAMLAKDNSAKLVRVNENLAKTLTGNLSYNDSNLFPGAMSPVLAGLTSKSQTRNLLTDTLFNHNFELERTLKGEGQNSIETEIQNDLGHVAATLNKTEKLYTQYAGTAGKSFAGTRAVVKSLQNKVMNYEEFMDEVGKAQMRGDKHQVPEVQQVAEMFRKEAEPFVEQLQIKGTLPEDLTPKTALSYFRRSYNVQKIVAEREDFESTGLQYWKSERSKAKAMEEELTLNKEKLTQLESRTAEQSQELEKISKQLSLAKASDLDLKQIQRDVTDNIIGLGDTRLAAMELSDKVTSTPSTRLGKERKFLIPDLMIEPWLHLNAADAHKAFMTNASAAIRAQEGLERLGFKDMNEVRAQIKEEYNRQELVTHDPEAKLKLKEQVDQDLQGVTDAMNIMTGRISTPKAGDYKLQGVRAYSGQAMLGSVLFAQISDLGTSVMFHGPVRAIVDGWVPAIRTLVSSDDFRTLGKQNIEDMGTAIQAQSSAIIQTMMEGEVTAGHRLSRGEKFVRKSGKIFGNISLVNQWTDLAKTAATYMISARAIRAVQAAKAGTITGKELKFLGTIRLGPEKYDAILDNYSRFGGEKGTTPIANLDKWDAQARHDFETAIRSNVNSTIITPERGDIPVGIQKSEGLKTLFYLQSFQFAATNKILISGLQRRDKETLAGMMALVGLGYTSYALNQLKNGKEIKTDLTTILTQGLNRSGATGILGSYAFALNPWHRSSRYLGNSLIETAAGPIGGVANNIGKLIKGGLNGDLDETAARNLIPGQNLFYLQAAATAVNGGK